MLLRPLALHARRSSHASVLAGLACAALASLVAPAASASEKVHVTVHAPGGKGCISSEKLEAAVEKRSGGAAKHADVDVHIEAADPGPGWVADVQVAGRAGRRVVSTKSSSCSRLDDGLVLVATLLADPTGEDPQSAAPAPGKGAADADAKSDTESEKGSSWGSEDEPGGSEDEDSPEPPDDRPGHCARKPGAPGDRHDPRNKARKPAAGDDDKDAPEKDPSGKDEADKGSSKAPSPEDWPGKVQFGIGADVVYATGLAPAGLPGLRASFSWLSPTPVAIEGSFTYYAELQQIEQVGAASAETRTRAFSVALSVCPARLDVARLHFGACGGVSLTHFEHESWGYPQSGPQDYVSPDFTSQDHTMAAPTLDLRFDVSLFSFLRIGAGIEAMVPVNRPGKSPWAQSATQDLAVDPVIFQGRAGITVVIPP